MIHDAKAVAIVSGIEPSIKGKRIGFTIFENHEWRGEEPGFDVNKAATEELKKVLTHPAQIYNGRELNLADQKNSEGSPSPSDETIKETLSKKAAGWGVDVVLLIRGGEQRDWISSSSVVLEDVGIFDRGNFTTAFSVLDLYLLDLKAGSYEKVASAHRGQRTPRIEWHNDWNAYEGSAKRMMLDGIRGSIRDSLAELFSKVGLAEAPADERSTLRKALFMPDRGKSWVPEGNDIPILEGISPADVHHAVLIALRHRGWKVISDEPNKVVANLVEKRKEAVETITISSTVITLTPERFEQKGDGERVKIEPHLRWNKNLKESIIQSMYDLAPTAQ